MLHGALTQYIHQALRRHMVAPTYSEWHAMSVTAVAPWLQCLPTRLQEATHSGKNWA